MEDKRENAAGKTPLLRYPVHDRVFSGTYYGAYLTRKGKLYALGAAEAEGILGKKDGKPLLSENVVHAAAGVRSIAYVTRDGHLHVYGGRLGRLFAEGPSFPGAKAVYPLNYDAFLAIGLDGKKYVFGENKNNIFQMEPYYWFQMNVPPADDPKILEVMRARKDDFGSLSTTELFANAPAYQKWAEEGANCPEAALLAQEYQGGLRLVPATKYGEDGSPQGMYLKAGVPSSIIIRPEPGFLENMELAPENVLDMSSPLFEDGRTWRQVNPSAHKKAIYLSDESRWLYLDDTMLYFFEGQKKTVIAKDVLDVDVSYLRVLILTTFGQLYQSRWRNTKGKYIEGARTGPMEFPLSTLPAFRERQSKGIFGKMVNSLASDWEEIHWKP